MNWEDDALVLGGRRFGEGGLILDVLTANRGRRSGLVYGGASRRRRAAFEVGNALRVAWTGRLEEQLGRFESAEPERERAARILDDPLALKALSCVTGLIRGVTSEGDDAGSALYGPSEVLLNALSDSDIWPALYVRWEFGLLSTLGFGLDLSACAISGANDGLTHVSPRTGRAVRGSEAAEYVDRLLPLPGFLLDSTQIADPQQIWDGLLLTGHFIQTRLFTPMNRPVPPEREQLLRALQRKLEAKST